MNKVRLADFILRAGVAFAFLYPPIAAIFAPDDWIGYFPSFMHGYVPDAILLHGFGLVEVIIALWILSGRNIFWPSLAATGLLLAIVVTDLQDFIVIFRDISIAAAAFALTLENAPRSGGWWRVSS